MASALSKVWWRRIKAEAVLFTECPSKLQGDVIILAKADVVNGAITAERYEELIGEPYIA